MSSLRFLGNCFPQVLLPDSALSNYLKKSFIKYINVKSSSSQTLRTLSKNVSFWEIIILNSTCSLHIKRSSNVDFFVFSSWNFSEGTMRECLIKHDTISPIYQTCTFRKKNTTTHSFHLIYCNISMFYYPQQECTINH